MIGKILNIVIDSGLKGVHHAEKFFGIAESVIRTSGTVNDRLPGIVSPDGEIIYAGIDDINPLMVYFKINSTTIVVLKNGTGNRYGDYANTFSVSAFIYWDRFLIDMSVDQMVMMMQSRLPMAITGVENIKTISIKISGANTNTLQIYSQEYASSEALKPLPANKHIVQLNFNIEITFNPECFRQCPECAVK